LVSSSATEHAAGLSHIRQHISAFTSVRSRCFPPFFSSYRLIMSQVS
jgi:hypothetical protein